MEYGIQMYSIRDLAEKDLDAALRAVSEMGYKNVEFAGFHGHSAEAVRDMLDKYNLKCVATHSYMHDLVHNLEATIEYHKIIGNHNYIIPSHDLNTRARLEEFIENCNVIAPKLRAAGIELGYHNHTQEFIPRDEGYIIHTELEKRCDIFFELDTYWAYVAKLDPVAELKRLGDRVRFIHLKDGSPEGRGCSLGSGSAPVVDVIKTAIEYNHNIVVESEGLHPTGKEEVQRCMDYLKTLSF